MSTTPPQVLRPLVARLRACPEHKGSQLQKRVVTGWADLTRQASGDQPAVPVMAALLLYDPLVGQLLDPTEHAQLLALVTLAIGRYQEKANPPNKIGQLLAGILNQPPEI